MTNAPYGPPPGDPNLSASTPFGEEAPATTYGLPLANGEPRSPLAIVSLAIGVLTIIAGFTFQVSLIVVAHRSAGGLDAVGAVSAIGLGVQFVLGLAAIIVGAVALSRSRARAAVAGMGIGLGVTAAIGGPLNFVASQIAALVLAG